MNVLTFSTLYPNAAQPNHGLFVETRLRHLCERHPVHARVVAPVPWFPFKSPRFGRYARFARAPRFETRGGFEVSHPRYPVIPRFGMTIAPRLLAHSALAEIGRLMAGGYTFDLIDAHYFYPDGVAAALVAKQLSKPLAITARGTDINLIAGLAEPRRQIRWAIEQAAAVIAVSDALRQAIVDLDVRQRDIHTLRNGVDLERFRPPADREALRARMGFTRPTLLSVGNLVELKGHDIVIRALRSLEGTDLVIVGEGPERQKLEALARDVGMAERVRFEGALRQHDLVDYYGAADVLTLVSSREGWANVLLESMACATPVVASRVGGNPEVVTAPEAGVLFAERTPDAVAEACRSQLESPSCRPATRRYAERFDWNATSDALWSVLQGVASAGSRADSCETVAPHDVSRAVTGE